MKKLLPLFLALVLAFSLIGVTASAAPNPVRIKTPATTLSVGRTVKLDFDVISTAIKYTSFTWTSDNPAVATVDATGRVTGVAYGDVNIKVSLFSGSTPLGTASVKLEVVEEAVKASRITIYSSSTTVKVGRSLVLDFRVYPGDKTVNYDTIEWDSDDYNIAYVDQYGEVTGSAPGDVTISVRIYGADLRKEKKLLGTGTIALTVVSDTGESYEPENKSAAKPVRESLLGEKISSATVTAAVKEAVVKGKTTRTTFSNAGSVSAATLQSAAAAMKNGGGTVLLNFDTMNSGKVEGRLTINPEYAKDLKGDINLVVNTNKDVTGATRKKLEEYFRNKFTLVKAGQDGSFGMNVTYSVKSDTPIAREKNLRLYSFDVKTNKYTEISGANISLDVSGYVHFTTNAGGYLIVSDGALKRA